MAYQTGTATGPEDLLDELFTFASANGWTINQATNGTQAFLSKSTVFVGFYYTSSMLKVYPATGFSASSPIDFPGEQPGSAFNDTATSTTTGINCNEMTGPYDAYWFFESDTYLHIVVSVNTNRYRHFGFGLAVQAGVMSGGEYFYGHYHSQGVSDINNPDDANHALPFSGYTLSSPTYNSVWVHGLKTGSPETALSGAPTSTSKWFNQKGAAYSDGDGDTTGEVLVSGTVSNRSNSVLSVGKSLFNGFVPLTPINFFIYDDSTTPDSCYPLGSAPDVRCVNIEPFTDEQEITIGSDNWFIFPIGRRGNVTASSPLVEGTGYYGLAYKKVTA